MSGQVLNTQRYKYKRVRIRDKNGKVLYSANNGDSVARCMLGASKDELVKIMNDNGLAERIGKHSAKNTGHFRMVLGQALRMLLAKKLPVTIRGQTVRSLTQRVPWPKGYKEEEIKPRVPKEDWRAAAETAIAIVPNK